MQLEVQPVVESAAAIEARIAEAERRLKAFGITLYPFQRVGAIRLASSPSLGLFDDPGLGKTVQGVLTPAPRSPVLVTCPAIVKEAWARWFRQARAGEFSIFIARSRAEFRWPRPGEVLIANYEILPPAYREVLRLEQKITDQGGEANNPILVNELRRMKAARRGVSSKPYDGTTILFDEAHRLKNVEALVTLRAREVAFAAIIRGGRVYPITGTPAMNKEREFYNVLQSAGLGAQAFGSAAQFDIELAKPDDPVLGAPPGWVEKMRGVSLKRIRSEVLPELPEKTRERYEVPLTKELREASDEFVAALKVAGVDLEKATLEAIQTAAIAKIPRELFAKLRAATAAAKIPALLELVEECEAEREPVVVFCDHRGPLDVLASRDGWGRISGAESEQEKTAVADAFQQGKLRGVACSIRAAGVGVTLTRAWRAIFADFPFNEALKQQAEDRLCRIGQTAKGLLYTRLVCEHVLECRMTDLVEAKAGMMERMARSAVPGGV